MPFTITDQKSYNFSPDVVYMAALAAVNKLEGNILQEKPHNHFIEAKFNKRILGKTLGDRTHLEVSISNDAQSDESTVDVEVYPLNAVGQRLMFGARKGVSRTVANWFFAHLEHQLPR